MKPCITIGHNRTAFAAGILATIAFCVLIAIVQRQSRELGALKSEVHELREEMAYWLPKKGKGGRI